MSELVAGLSIGLAAGFAPGPLQALVFTSTIQRGFAAGWRVAVVPLLTDGPIVVVSILAVGSLPEALLRGLGIGGGVAVAAFGVWQLIEIRRGTSHGADSFSGDMWRAAVANVLSPHPWLFWVAAGGPLVVSVWDESPARALAFIGGFYGALVGAKVILAVVVASTRHRLSGAWRQRLVVAGGVLLILGGAVIVVNWA